ncbi:hypothetical protein BH18VER1_BH18VER1_01370 [soil metagenome]
MAHFFEINFFALLSLAVALVGGVPGMVALLDKWRRSPKFGVTVPNFIIGERVADGVRQAVILLTATIWNAGETPIYPEAFDLELKFDGRWIQFDRCLIPENATFQEQIQLILAPALAASDLQRCKQSISCEMPGHGYLMFVTNRLPIEFLREVDRVPVRITCRDVSGRERRFALTLPERIGNDAPITQQGFNAPSRR